jgi:hypothetical protein
MKNKLNWLRFGVLLLAVLVTIIGIYIIQVNNSNPLNPEKTGIIVVGLGSCVIGLIAISWFVQVVIHFCKPE